MSMLPIYHKDIPVTELTVHQFLTIQFVAGMISHDGFNNWDNNVDTAIKLADEFIQVYNSKSELCDDGGTNNTF